MDSDKSLLFNFIFELLKNGEIMIALAEFLGVRNKPKICRIYREQNLSLLNG